jgi:serine/threonine-protein kinase
MRTLVAGRLRLVDAVGAGGSGTVWRAWDVRSHRYVAAKLHTQPVPDEPVAVRHPHVLTAAEWLDAGMPISLMRLVRGGTADRLLADHGALPAAYVAVLLDQLLDALGTLHAVGFAHRDVKPAHLLLEPTGNGRPHLWLSDLDLAAALDAPSSTFVGTDGYLAPEVAPGAPTRRGHDLFGAGATAAELLTGRIPRRDRDLPRGPLGGFLRRLVAADPDERPPTAEEARAELRAIGVPRGAPWQRCPRPPDVVDHMRRLSLLERWQAQVPRAASAAAASGHSA